MKYFVFTKGLRGPEGQILSELPVIGEGKGKQTYLFGPHELSIIEQSLSLNSLIEKFRNKVKIE